MTSSALHIEGHLPLDDPLSPRWQFDDTPLLAQGLTCYEQNDLWQQDTQRLPFALRGIRTRARAFATAHIAPHAMTLDTAEHLPAGQLHPQAASILKQAGQEGWLSYLLPAPIGSMPLTAAFYPPVWHCSLVVEEFSAACGGIMLLLSAPHLGAMPLLLSGDVRKIWNEVRSVYRACQNGDPHVMAFAITEPGAGSDAEDGHGAQTYRPGVVARAVPGGWLLNGRKVFISGGDIAKTATVFAALEGEGMASWTCFYVDCQQPGFKVVRTELKMGMRASGATELEFHDVFVPDSAIVGGLRKGWALNRATLNTSRIPVAAMGVGFARAATEIAVDFSRTQRLGGKPLIHYQEVQLQLADMVAETRALRSLIWQEARHAWRPRQLQASACKFHATDRAQRVCEMAMDLLGENGFVYQTRLEKVMRDVRLTRIFEGTNQINRLSLIEDWQAQLLDDRHATGV